MSIETPPDNLPAPRPAQPSLAPQNFRDAVEFSKMVANSAFVPKEFRGKPAEILAAIQFGFELGVGPMQAMQNIAVINGRPSVYGDLALALVQASGLMEYIEEHDDGNVATCKVKRRGEPNPHITSFSNADARLAGLSGKTGPWTQYPARMRMFRARGFALRDKFADVLKGLITREEAEDYPAPTAYAPSASTGEPAIDASATVVDTGTGELLKPSDKASPEQRIKLTELAARALGSEEEGTKWRNQRLHELGRAKWGDVTVGDIQVLTKELMEFSATNQEPPPDDNDENVRSFEEAQAGK